MKNVLIIFYTLFWMLTWESNICFSFVLVLFYIYIYIYIYIWVLQITNGKLLI